MHLNSFSCMTSESRAPTARNVIAWASSPGADGMAVVQLPRLCTKGRSFKGACKNRVTLKALANVSPGFALKPWVQKCPGRLFATLKGLRGFAVNKRRRNSFRVAPSRNGMRFPRVAKAQPWAGIGERFQRYSFQISLSQKWVSIRLFVQSLSKA